MSEAITQNHPSRQVERIREILVGRQLEGVEKRLNRLEMQLHPRMMPLPGDTASAGPDVFQLRLEKIEQGQQLALQELRDQIEAAKTRQVEETRHLTQQIQTLSRHGAQSEPGSYQEMEGKIGSWLESWQDAWNLRLIQRDEILVNCVRDECLRLKSWMEEKLQEHQKTHGELHTLRTNFAQLAQAARAFADATETTPASPVKPKLGVLPISC